MVDDAPEPYQSLYRRYRPRRFAEVRGQEHVTRALVNSVREGRVAHAYLFSGPRGTGKTSTARILAMALNCEAPLDGEPCGACESCVAIRQGSSLDVHELDGASNRRIDEMRDLLAGVALGTTGRWKVYIVDEVHQLTADASSALLKTLEEPPGHVIFVLATTDPQRVLPTIRSRTQHFEFHLLGADVLGGLLTDVNEAAGLGVDPDAIDRVVRRGQGSARDALSVLDQVAAAGTVEDEATVVSDIVEALADRDVGRVLVAVAECMRAGHDPRRLAADLIAHLRNGFLASQARDLVLLGDEEAAAVEAQAQRLGLAALVRAMEVIGQASIDMRDSVDPRVTLEVALVRVAAPAADTQPAALLERIERLERRVGEGGGQPVGGGGSAGGGPVGDGAPAGGGLQSGDDRPAGGGGAAGGGRPAGGGGAAGGASAESRSVAQPAGPPTSLGPPPPVPRPSRGAAPSTPRSSGSASPRPVPPPEPGPGGPPQAAASSQSPVPVTPQPAVPPADQADGASAGLPTRDDLTLAWGDVILPGLPGRVRAYVQLGRFLDSAADTAVYALPDPGLLARAETIRGDVEAAITAHFGRRVPLRLVLDDSSTAGGVAAGATAQGRPPVAAEPAPEEADDYGLPAMEDVAEMEDAREVVSPEQRLLQAFPGAEEVTP